MEAEFESIIKQIFYLVGEYGIDNTPSYKVMGMSKDEKKQFLINCRKGFRLGQDLMVKETVRVLEEIKKNKSLKKEAKREKSKEQLELLSIVDNRLQWQLALLRHFADFLAWMFFRNEWHKIRRVYSGSRTRPSLLESNLQSVLDSVAYFHSLDDLNFALITDLTSFMDIGDLLVITADKYFFVECKSGDVQRRIYDFIEELKADEFDPAKVDYSNKDVKFFDQLERTLRQQERNSHAVNFFNKEEGMDPFLKKEVNLVISEALPAYYHKNIAWLAEESFKEDSAYDSIEEVIYLAAYRNTKLGPSHFVFEHMIQQVVESYISVDLMQLIYVPLKEPLLFKPIGKEVLFDLMFNRLKIYIGLDIEKLIWLFNEKGVEARWLTEIETKQYKSKGGPVPFVYKGRAIQVSTNGHTLILGTTFTVNLMLDNMTPSALVDRYATLH